MHNKVIFNILLSLLPLLASATAFDDAVAAMDALSLPLVNLDIDLATVTDADYTQGGFTIVSYNSATNQLDTVSSPCELKIRGGTAKYNKKKSYNLKFIDENGDKRDVNVLGLREDNTWILDAMAIDPARMRNRVCFDLWNEFGRLPYDTEFGGRNGTVGAFVEVYAQGAYHGLYCLTDKVNRKLLDLKKVKVDDTTGDVTVRGVLYKGESWTTATTLGGYKTASTASDKWNGWELSYPDDYPSRAAWQPLMDLINALNKDLETVSGYYLDWFYMDNLVDYWLLLAQFNVLDMPYKNTFLSTINVQNSHRYVITPWDMDASFGRTYDGSLYDQQTVIRSQERRVGPYFDIMGNNVDDINGLVVKRWYELSKTTFAPEHVIGIMRAYAERFDNSGAWQRERAKWNNSPVALGETAMSELEYVERWYRDNYAHMHDELMFDLNHDHLVNIGDVNLLLDAILQLAAQ